MDRRPLLALIFLFLITGCSSSTDSVTPPDLENEIVESSEQFSSIGSNGKELPFVLDILDEFNDGARLHILARVRPRVVWNANETVIRLKGMYNGQVIGTSHFPLSKINKETAVLSPEDVTTVSLSIPSDNLSDYQLELLWGGEAVPLLRRNLSELLRIENVSVQREKCDEYPCAVPLTISADLVNVGTELIDNAELSVGFMWVDDLTQQSESIDAPISAEEIVSVPKLNLLPGTRRTLRLRLATPVPHSESGGYQPVLRVVDQPSSSS